MADRDTEKACMRKKLRETDKMPGRERKEEDRQTDWVGERERRGERQGEIGRDGKIRVRG